MSKDQKYWDEIAEKLSNDPNADPTELIGKQFTSKGPIRMIPDILQNGDSYIFLVLSTVAAIGDYGENSSKVKKHITMLSCCALISLTGSQIT